MHIVTGSAPGAPLLASHIRTADFSRGRTGVAVYSPDGKELGSVPTPEPAKNVAFGRGADRDLLYITAGRSLYRIRVEREGHQVP